MPHVIAGSDGLELQFFQKSSPTLTFTFTNKKTGVPIDMTGATGILSVNPEEDGSGTELFQNTSGVPSGTPTDGTMTFTLTTSETDQTAGKYYYDVRIDFGGGNVQTLLRASFQILAKVNSL